MNALDERGLDERAMLLLLTDAVGTGFGTEHFCLFLYSLMRMQAPRTVVELGTGLGLTTFWMALAAKSNNAGHIWTVDDFEFFDKQMGRFLAAVKSNAKK